MYSAGCDNPAELLRDPVLVGYVEHLGAGLRGVVDELRNVEERQVKLDRRLAEFGGLLQGLQEEQLSRGASLERNSQVATVAVQNRLEADHITKRLETCCEQHGQWLRELTAEVAALGGHVKGAGKGRGGRQDVNASSAALDERLAALELGQKTVAVGARRALHTALIVHQQQQSQDHDNQWEKCLDSLPVADLECQFTRRFTEQDSRLDKVIQMVDTLADKVAMQHEASEGLRGSSGERGLRRLRDRVEAIEVSVRDKVEEIESNLMGLATDLERYGPSLADLQAGENPENIREFMAVAIESLENRLDRNLHEVSQKMELLQDGREQQRLLLRQIGQQLPEVARKLDQLWAQCQYYFPRVKEHDVHFSFFRTSFETHKQSWLDQADGLELRESRVGNWSEPSLISPAMTSATHIEAQSLFPTPPMTTQTAPGAGLSRDPAPSAALQGNVGDSFLSTSDGLGGPGSLLGPAASSLGQAAANSSSVLRPGSSAAERATVQDDAELGARQRMLQQVMARLHSSTDDDMSIGVGAATS